MKYCRNCGNPMEDDVLFCPKCGAEFGKIKEEKTQATSSTSGVNNDTYRILYLVSFIFCIIGTITMALAIFPLIWCIPLTIMTYNSYKDGVKLSVGVEICILLFVSLPAGIILLIADSMKK